MTIFTNFACNCVVFFITYTQIKNFKVEKKKRKFFCCDRIFIQALSLHRYWALGLNMALTQFNIHSGFPFTFFVVIFILLSRFTPRGQTDLTLKLIMLCAHLVARNDDNMYVWWVWKQVRVRFFPFHSK